MRAEYLYFAILFFVFLAFFMVVSMLFIVLNKSRMKGKRRALAAQMEGWIMDVILEKEGSPGHVFAVPPSINDLLQTPIAKKVLLRELMKVKKSLSGVSGKNLEILYAQLSLDQVSLQRLESKKWHIKAKGIQELAVMHQHSQYSAIFNLTNDQDMMVRMEAQTSIVRLNGYKGLQFFDNLSYPLSEWHQLNLLHLLAHEPVMEEHGVIKWLNSSNATVVQFSLKLIAGQHAIELYDEVVKCLHHTDEVVRKEAVLCLGQMPSPSVALELNNHYRDETDKNIRLCIIDEFQRVASRHDLPFLQTLQQADDVDVKLAANKTVLYLEKNLKSL
ncbi:MAG: HEAT repeat domain-containing protein [Ferruginibacter sp.]